MVDKRAVASNVLPIGYDKPVFVIAEAGINHGGNLDVAINMAFIASACGADAVKYQTFLECELSYKNLTYKQTKVLKEYCDEIGRLLLSGKSRHRRYNHHPQYNISSHILCH